MFKNNDYEDDTNGQPVDDTVIGQSIKIEGELVSNGSITVEGEVIGSVRTEKVLKIGEKAKVKAEVKANEAYISGKVDGNVCVQGKLQLSSTAEVNGDIEANSLTIAEGAVFNGKCSMTEKTMNSVVEEEVKDDEENE